MLIDYIVPSSIGKIPFRQKQGKNMQLEDNPQLYTIRHSFAHVLAQAVKQHFPDAKLGFGPPTDTGFFYDFDFGDKTLQESDLKQIEKSMKKIISQKQEFHQEDDDAVAARERLSSVAEPYKLQNVENLFERGEKNFRFYQNGPFLDLCEGPHVAHTGELPAKAFKLDRIAGAYWLGNEKNKMLTRIYGLAFEKPEELQAFIQRRENAKKFDHKKLGKELELFHFDDIIGKGLPLWLPNGTIVKDEVEKFAREMEFDAGYKRVSSPVIAKKQLYLRSQHLPAYEKDMFPPMECHDHDNGEPETFYLRPMNCPHHHMMFGIRKRSYKELPLRLAEYGNVYRYEKSGELSGLIRVRGMCQNDAHIYCTADQIGQEVETTINLYKNMYEVFGLKDYYFRLSLRSDEEKDKFKGDEAMWAHAEKLLTKLMDESGIPYKVGKGEAAFYGPKIDIQFKNLMGREETVSTIQLDFLSPKNFNLLYIDEQGQEQSPVIIHRAPLSTHERFISFITEYYGGAFPTWMAPVQVMVIPVGENCHEFCKEMVSSLKTRRVRVEMDSSNASFGKKIRSNTVAKIPIMLIIGEKEVESKSVTIRRYGVEKQETISFAQFQNDLMDEILTRRRQLEPMGSII